MFCLQGTLTMDIIGQSSFQVHNLKVLHDISQCCGLPLNKIVWFLSPHNPVCMAFQVCYWIICSSININHSFQEYNVRANAITDKTYSIGRFVTGLPPFSKKKNAENKWALHKEGLQGRQITENMRVCIYTYFWLYII